MIDVISNLRENLEREISSQEQSIIHFEKQQMIALSGLQNSTFNARQHFTCTAQAKATLVEMKLQLKALNDQFPKPKQKKKGK